MPDTQTRGRPSDVLGVEHQNLDALYTFIAKNIDASGTLSLPANLNVTGNIVATGSISGGTLIDTPPITANGALGYTGDLFRAQINSVDVWEVDDTGLAQSAGVDALTAGAFTIGHTTATSVVITPNTTISGTLGVTGAITGNVTGNVSGSSGSTTGNAATATALATARNINGVAFDGTANITVTADASTLSGTTLKSTVLASSLTSVGTLASLAVTGATTSGGVTSTVNAGEAVTALSGTSGGYSSIAVGRTASEARLFVAATNGQASANAVAGDLVVRVDSAASNLWLQSGPTNAAIQITGTATAILGALTIADGKNVVLGSGTGTKIGTATTQLLGFYNATPVAQRSGAAQAAVVTTGSALASYGYTQSQADSIVTLVNELRAWAVAQGFIKGSA